MRPAPLHLPLDSVPYVEALPSGSVIPVAPNPNFTGRDEELKTLAREIRVRIILTPKLLNRSWHSWRNRLGLERFLAKGRLEMTGQIRGARGK
ncbi:MAG: hypothetical protein WAM60_15870 [Candidatus Promineifilaceae bacterium]